MAALAAKVDELSQACARLGQVCERLGRENGDLRDQVRRLTVPAGPARMAGETGQEDGGRGGRQVSRRSVGRALGLAAAGAIGAVALADATASPAAAANGASVVAGTSTTAESATVVQYNGPAGEDPGVILLANDTGYSAFDGLYPAALGGWASSGHVSNGVYGYTEVNQGDAVIGFNSAVNGNGVHGVANGISKVGVLGENSAGTAVSGITSGTADGLTAVLGTISAYAPGATSAAVKGHNWGKGDWGIGVWGTQDGAGVGVYGTTKSGYGVYGDGGTGTGLYAKGQSYGAVAESSLGAGLYAIGATAGLIASGKTAVQATGTAAGVTASGKTAVQATGTAVGVTAAGPIGVHGSGSGSAGRGGVFAGAAAQLRLTPGTLASHPKSGQAGDLYADKTGRLWFCKAGGATATWHQIA